MQKGESNVARYLPQLAASSPERTALRIPLRKSVKTPLATGTANGYLSLSYAQVETLASGLCHAFAARGITRGMRVLLMLKPGRDLILTVFALFKMGAVPVVIDPGMGLKAFRACVVRTRPGALVGIAPGQMIARVFRKDFANVGIRITLGGRSGLGVLLGNSFGKDRLDELVSGQPTHFEPVATAADELAAILFTSGSTGSPKGVCYEHGMFEAQVRMVRETYGIEPGEVDLPLLPVFALFGPALGLTSVVPEMNPGKPASVDPALLVRAIEDNAVTNSFGSPVLWTKIANYCEAQGKTLPSLKRVLMAGAPAHPTLLRRLTVLLPSAEVHTPYGATEVLPVSSISAREVLEQTATLTQQGFGTCVGRPLPGVRVRIIEAPADEGHRGSNAAATVNAPPASEATPIASTGAATAVDAPSVSAFMSFAKVRILPPGQIGEIVVTGPSVTKVYDHLPEATALAKIWDATEQTLWHRMGDVGIVDAEGRLWFCGRKVERVFLSAPIGSTAIMAGPTIAATPTTATPSTIAAISTTAAVPDSTAAAATTPPVAVASPTIAAPAETIRDLPVAAAAPAIGAPAETIPDPTATAASPAPTETAGRQPGALAEPVLPLAEALSPAVAALRDQGVLCTDCVEGIMNAHPQVFRTALVGVAEGRGQSAHLMVEPWPQDWPQTAEALAQLKASLRALADAHAITRPLVDFHVRKRFPVDVRHNAKIHRLAMARELAAALKVRQGGGASTC